MNQRDLTHQWAHQIKPHGKASALSYDGPVIRSYSTAMGRILPGGAVVLNAARFSVTTSKHQSFIRQAIPSAWRVFYFADDRRGTDLNPTPEQLLAHSLRSCLELVDKAARARKDPGWWLGQVMAARKAVLDVCEHFNLPTPSDLPGEPTEADMEKAREKVLEMERKRMEKARAKLAAWQAGDAIAAPQGLPHAFFRLMPTDPTTVESTLGVRVPVAEFTQAVRFVMRFKGATWRPNPGEEIKVGGYRVNSITPAGVVAGCHKVNWSEVERLASFL